MTLLDRLKYDFWVTADRQFFYFPEMSQQPAFKGLIAERKRRRFLS